MTVSPKERDSMARLMQIMNGDAAPAVPTQRLQETVQDPLILPGAGQITNQDISAMADVIHRLENAVNNASGHMINSNVTDSQLQEALITKPTQSGVKIGIYKIDQSLDENRVAGKQSFNVVNSTTGTMVAHELSLYEAAHALVRYLNNSKYFNSAEVRQLLEAEASYTSHKIDAVRFHRMMIKAQKTGDVTKSQLMETRKQASLDRAMEAKRQVKYIFQHQ
jgi:hypothetical protein